MCTSKLRALALPAIFLSHQAIAQIYTPEQSFPVIDPGYRIYAYAAASVYEWPREYHYYCTSKNPVYGVPDVMDHIGLSVYNVATGRWEANHQLVLAPASSGQWDDYHICDPEVLKGKFVYNRTSYTYAMFYLGISGKENDTNKVGVAFSNSYYGPWVRYHKPLIECETGVCDGAWGVGQPAATSVDGAGRMLLFYTKGSRTGTATYRRDINLSDMSKPVLGSEVQLRTEGLTQTNGKPDIILNNMAIVYNGSRDRFIIARSGHPLSTSTVVGISTEVQVASIPGIGIWVPGMSQWTVMGNITYAHSGKLLNHDAGILRDPYGGMPTNDYLHLIHGVADTTWNTGEWGWLHSYKLYRNDGILR